MSMRPAGVRGSLWGSALAGWNPLSPLCSRALGTGLPCRAVVRTQAGAKAGDVDRACRMAHRLGAGQRGSDHPPGLLLTISPCHSQKPLVLDSKHGESTSSSAVTPLRELTQLRQTLVTLNPVLC